MGGTQRSGRRNAKRASVFRMLGFRGDGTSVTGFHHEYEELGAIDAGDHAVVTDTWPARLRQGLVDRHHCARIETGTKNFRLRSW